MIPEREIQQEIPDKKQSRHLPTIGEFFLGLVWMLLR